MFQQNQRLMISYLCGGRMPDSVKSLRMGTSERLSGMMHESMALIEDPTLSEPSVVGLLWLGLPLQHTSNKHQLGP
jgi:hypothetical protein